MLVQVLPPFLVDLHGLDSSGCALGREPLGLGVLDHVLDILWVHRIEDGEEVVSIWVPVFRVLVLQILHDFRIAFELREDVLDAELVVLGHVHRALLADLEQFLFALKYRSDEVTVHGSHRRHKELNCAKRIRYFVIDLRCSLK